MKVSIITVCYNSVKTIEKAILSVLNQDYDKIEYIIIDGGSTDGTLDVIKKYSERISKIISEPDDGIYDAMNKGIRLSTGNIIGIINSDDWYAEGTVSAAVNAFLEDSERDVVHGRQIDVLQDGSLVEHGVKGIMSDDYIATFCHPTFFVKRKVYEENGVFDCQYSTDADGDLVYRLYLAGVKFHYDDSVCAFFRIGTGASSTEAAARERYYVNCKYAQKLPLEKREIAQKALEKAREGFRILRAVRYLDKRIHWREPVLHKEKKIFIFGAGFLGREMLKWLMDNNRGSDIECFLDNSSQSQGRIFDGIYVKPVETIKKFHNDVCVVIATSKYYDEMREQICNYGVNVENVFSYFHFKRYLSGTDLSSITAWVGKAAKHQHK